MTGTTADRFIRALQQVEETGNVEPLAELFADDAEISSLAVIEPLRGYAGAREFWKEYLHAFDHIHSQFTRVIEHDGEIILEWKSEGVLRNGCPIDYCGVSILETADGRVRRFRSYYDTAAFLKPLPCGA